MHSQITTFQASSLKFQQAHLRSIPTLIVTNCSSSRSPWKLDKGGEGITAQVN
jgi:hypothetical protein